MPNLPKQERTPGEDQASELVQKTLYDLRENQVALELQNETLRRTQVEQDASHTHSQTSLQNVSDGLEIQIRERTADLQSAMNSLKTERQRFNDIFDILPLYVILVTRDYHIPFANRYFTDRFGHSGGKRCYEYLFGRTQPCETCTTLTPFTTHAPYHGEWIGPDRRMYAVDDFLFTDVDGSLLILEMGIDITERKQAEESLYQLAAIVESSNDAITGKQLDGTIITWNNAAEKIYGYRAEEVIGKSISLLEPSGQPGDALAVLEKIRLGKQVAQYETMRLKKDGSTFAVSISVSPIIDSTGTIIGASTISRDISQRKQMEFELIEANKMKLLGQLTSGVAHEVRNPLNGIMAIMGALAKELSDEERFKPYMQHMRSQVSRLSVLMEDLLALGKPLREEAIEAIPIIALVQKTIATWRQTLLSPKLAVEFICPDTIDTLIISGDTASMTQVIINLLENARQHSPEDTKIVCSIIRRFDNRVVIAIKDFGTGIPEGYLSKIFEPFFTTRKGGTGLGLSIIRRIVDNHEGTISAYNNTDGRGATFEVVLPLHLKK